MRRSFLLVVLVACFVGCANGDPGISIRGNFPPDDTCVYGNNPMATEFLSGLYDVAQPSPYRFGGLISSFYVNNSTEFDQDKNGFNVEGYEVELLTPAGERIDFGGAIENPYRVLANGRIESTSDPSAPSYGAAPANVIPIDYQDVLEDLLGASPSPSYTVPISIRLRVFGKSDGSLSTTSRPYFYTLQLCRGCLEDCTGETSLCPFQAGQDSFTYCSTDP